MKSFAIKGTEVTHLSRIPGGDIVVVVKTTYYLDEWEYHTSKAGVCVATADVPELVTQLALDVSTEAAQKNSGFPLGLVIKTALEDRTAAIKNERIDKATNPEEMAKMLEGEPTDKQQKELNSICESLGIGTFDIMNCGLNITDVKAIIDLLKSKTKIFDVDYNKQLLGEPN